MANRYYLSVLFIGLAVFAGAEEIHVEVYSAQAADVNSFVLFDRAGSVIVDATRSSKEAGEVAKLARSHGTSPTIILITHGHPDHYLGMGALKKDFPQSRIFVARQEIKDDIIRFAAAAEKGHWFDDEPLMKAKSPANPDGFDYEGDIHVMKGNVLQLPGGAKLDVRSDFSPTEAAHETVLFSKDRNALFASDLVYNGVHLWMGRGVDSQDVKNWRAELENLKKQYGARNVKIYPGHGQATNSGIFDIDLEYLRELLASVKEANTPDEAKAVMMRKYPAWKNTDFILTQSIKNQFELARKTAR